MPLRNLFALLGLVLLCRGPQCCTPADRLIAEFPRDKSADSAAAFGAAGVAGANDGDGAAVAKDDEGLLTDDGLTLVSFDGYLNGQSFQQDGIVSFAGIQYAAFWNSKHHAVLARRKLPDGGWSGIEFNDYDGPKDDAHTTISLGICSGDGTLHVAFAGYGDVLYYRRSAAGLLGSASSVPWDVTSFSKLKNEVEPSAASTRFIFPRFVSEPGGMGLLLEARVAGDTGADENLWEYSVDSQTWSALGAYISGAANSVGAYPHWLSYSPGGKRLHVSWCWRENADASTNHDLMYMYSDDNGRTWSNGLSRPVGTSGNAPVTQHTAGITAWAIAQNRGLINQEHMAVDQLGQVHVLLSHLPDGEPDNADFDSARAKSSYFHYVRDANGTWSRNALGIRATAAFRGKLAVAASGNIYAILPNLRIAGASLAADFHDWALLDTTDSGRFISDPLIDTSRLASEGMLSVYYPQKGSPNIDVLDYQLH